MRRESRVRWTTDDYDDDDDHAITRDDVLTYLTNRGIMAVPSVITETFSNRVEHMRCNITLYLTGTMNELDCNQVIEFVEFRLSQAASQRSESKMTEYEDDKDRRDREEDERIWRERKQEIQSRVTPEDYAMFLQQLEQIEARVVGHGIGGDDGEADEFIFAAIRNVFYTGYMCGLNATYRN